jgi:Tfp pilus assembly protein PilF
LKPPPDAVYTLALFNRDRLLAFGMRTHRLAGLLVLLLAAAPAAAAVTSRELMQFGVEAARQGLWREALFRWERAVKDDAKNPRLRNNLAVAYESLGRFEDAAREYREARQLFPDSREIRDNQESFLQMHPAFKETPDKTKEAEEGAKPPSPDDHP